VRGYNDTADVVDLARRVKEKGWHVRFIETMPLGEGEVGDTARQRFVPSRETRALIEAALGQLLFMAPGHHADEARNFRFADDAPGTVGFISPVSEPYCGSCNRMRLTADGKFHLCLLNEDALDVRNALRSGGGDAAVEAILRAAVTGKPAGHMLAEGLSIRSREMFQIGG
jgi:cyclic pyranopterin phosphate synthase